jgi:hypothetical protein
MTHTDALMAEAEAIATKVIADSLDADGAEVDLTAPTNEELAGMLVEILTDMCTDGYVDDDGSEVYWGINEDGEPNEDGQMPQWIIRMRG